jgi:hypothetical protein
MLGIRIPSYSVLFPYSVSDMEVKDQIQISLPSFPLLVRFIVGRIPVYSIYLRGIVEQEPPGKKFVLYTAIFYFRFNA